MSALGSRSALAAPPRKKGAAAAANTATLPSTVVRSPLSLGRATPAGAVSGFTLVLLTSVPLDAYAGGL